MSPKFSLRIKRTTRMCQLSIPNNKVEAAVARKILNKKHEELDNARGHFATRSSSTADSSVVLAQNLKLPGVL